LEPITGNDDEQFDQGETAVSALQTIASPTDGIFTLETIAFDIHSFCLNRVALELNSAG